MPERIGIFGSAFNPPHNAHFTLTGAAREHFKLDRLVYVPTRLPPHKRIEGDWDEATRELMIRIASFSDTPADIGQRLKNLLPGGKDTAAFLKVYSRDYPEKHDPSVTVSDIETRKPGISYSIDTVKEIRGNSRDGELHIIIGMDQAVVFDSWKDWKELPKLARICAGNRPGCDEALVRKKYPFIEIFAIPPSEVSSTDIREKIAKNQSIRGLVPNIIGEFLKVL